MEEKEKLIFNENPVIKVPGQAYLFFESRPNGDLYLKISKDGSKFYYQWIIPEKDSSQSIRSNDPLFVKNSKRDNQIIKLAKDKYELDAANFLSKAGEFIYLHHSKLFPKSNKLLERNEKDEQIIKIANQLDHKFNIVISKLTGYLHIYNPKKGVFEAYTDTEFAAFLNKTYKQKFLKDEVMKIMGTFTNIKDESENYIAFKNCLLNMDTLETEEFNSKEFVTFQVPFNWNTEAESEFFENKINEILDDRTNYLQFMQMVGYCFTLANPHNKMFFITGDGANGKSTLMAIIHAIFHNSVGAVGLHEFKNDFGLQPLLGKKINILYDLPQKTITDTGHIKAVTGEDLITINRKHKDSITTQLGCKIIGVGNHLPPVNEDTYAFWRRVLHIELTRTFDESQKDIKLKEKLIDDTIGMEWLIHESIKAYKNVETNGWAAQKTEKQIKREYFKLSNPCLFAASELFESSTNPEDYITRAEAVEIISEYLKSEEIRLPKNNNPYYAAIRSMGGDDTEKRINDIKTRVFTFIKIKSPLKDSHDEIHVLTKD